MAPRSRADPSLALVVIVVAALAFMLQHISGKGKDWQYFIIGSELLFGQNHLYTPLAGGLHVYANYPTIQIGPLVCSSPRRSA